MQAKVERSQERRPPPRKDTSLVRQALGHHRRDTVAHRDAIEGDRDLHRALLVRDDNQLRGLLQLYTKDSWNIQELQARHRCQNYKTSEIS